MLRVGLVCALTTLGLLGCQAQERQPRQESPTQAAQSEPPPESLYPSAQDSSGGSVTVQEAGFGQEGRYVRAQALLSAAGGQGRFITVHFNVYDGDTLIGSGEQVEQVTVSPGRQMALGTQIDVGNGKATSVKTDIALSEYAGPSPSAAVIDVTKAQDISKSAFGTGYEARFLIKNPTDQPWTDVRIGVVCVDKAGEIIGGGSLYPRLIPAKGESLERPALLTTSGEPSSCTAYPGG